MSKEKQYIQAFNNGYVLAQFEPKLLEAVTQRLTPINTYLQGIFDGKKQCEIEFNKSQLFELQELRLLAQAKEKGFGRGNVEL